MHVLEHARTKNRIWAFGNVWTFRFGEDPEKTRDGRNVFAISLRNNAIPLGKLMIDYQLVVYPITTHSQC